MVSQVYLSSNGWVSLEPNDSPMPFANCLETAALPPGTLAAFWADLDPGAGGTVRAGPFDAETYVISFESVPPWVEVPDPNGPAYTFEIVLHANGDVDYLFGDMGELPARWAMGMAMPGGRSQNLACYKAPQDLAHRRWTLHNQPAVTTWLTTDRPVVVVPPGSSADLGVVLKGFGYVPWLSRPFLGLVRLTTNDPGQPAVDLTAQAVVGPPAVTIWMPLTGR
jgi:hypothetical protein